MTTTATRYQVRAVDGGGHVVVDGTTGRRVTPIYRLEDTAVQWRRRLERRGSATHRSGGDE